jgi:hypothetical protein
MKTNNLVTVLALIIILSIIAILIIVITNPAIVVR